ncbi:MAG: DUF488 family protein [Myxococcales bacterium]|nr:DUF488 family protein [Myxococcales bacterium]
MPVRTRRFNDPAEPDDGYRLLVTRYRPRGVSKSEESWDDWWPHLGPSRDLHAAFWGKNGAPPLDFATYEHRFLQEMQAQTFHLRALIHRHKAGETITLLCSSACSDESRCHRSILRRLIESR